MIDETPSTPGEFPANAASVHLPDYSDHQPVFYVRPASLQPLLNDLPTLYEFTVGRRVASPFSGQILCQFLVGLRGSINALFPRRLIPAFPPLDDNFIRLRCKQFRPLCGFCLDGRAS